MTRSPWSIALVFAAVVGMATPAMAQQSNPDVLERNPFKAGLSDWKKQGKAKAFQWDSEGAELQIRGQSGKEPSRMYYGLVAWDEYQVRMKVKKGARKFFMLFQPAVKGEPKVLEIPKSATKKGRWIDLTVHVGGGRISVDAGEEEVAAVEVPARSRWHVGFDAPSGANVLLTTVKIVRKYENPEQYAEEGFRSIFDGSSRDLWRGNNEDMDRTISVDKGRLVTEVRSVPIALVGFRGGSLKEYELRFRVMWGSNGLIVRPLEVAGMGGQISKLHTIQVNLGDHLDPLDVTDVVIRLEKRHCKVTVNGKTVFDSDTSEYKSTPFSFMVPQGKRCAMRDIRIKLLGDAAKAGGGSEDEGE
ncbi:MAG: LamG domain-containing protein [Planctomycetota bacterium]|jgi:hypothetical protein